MFKLNTLAASCLILCLSASAQHHPVEVISYSGNEILPEENFLKTKPKKFILPNQTIFSQGFTFEMHNITDIATSYDLQSHASAQQLWYNIPDGTLNAVFQISQFESGFQDRTCTYFFSTDAGVTWSVIGEVPPSAVSGGVVSGFPSIIGLSSGRIVIANHSALGGGVTRTQLFINSAPGQYDFVNYDPGQTSDGGAIWSKIGVSENNNIIIGSSVNGGTGAWTNTFDYNNLTFSGWHYYDGDQAETYHFAASEEGRIGHAYIDETRKAWFRESEDEGLSWKSPVLIFEPFLEIVDSDTFLHAAFRGINAAYIQENPKVVFEVYRLKPDLSVYYPHLPSEIYFWSPDVNNGQSIIIADSNNVPFYPNQGNVSVFSPIARPVIGKSYGDGALFAAFYASSEDISSYYDSTRFYIGYFMMSADGGKTWTNPARFTPITSPPLDWRWVSIAPVNPVSGNSVKVHLVMVGDTVAGQFIPGPWNYPLAKFYHFSTEISLTNVDKETEMVSSFRLHQNYPNPFNPLTTIGYQIPDAGYVTLKIFDVLGNDISTLANEFKPAGKYEVSFDASSLASGVYYYQLRAGNFIKTKKMILIR